MSSFSITERPDGGVTVSMVNDTIDLGYHGYSWDVDLALQENPGLYAKAVLAALTELYAPKEEKP